MIKFDIITIFPNVFQAYFNESILRRATKKKLIEIKIHNLRDYTTDKHHKVDDRPFGGGPGMVMKIEPLVNALKKIFHNTQPRKNLTRLNLVIFLDANGKQFTSKMAADFSKKYHQIILICGHYEGVDARIKQIVKAYGLRLMALSVGPYVLTGGELPAMTIIDAVSRHIPGVLGKAESLEEKRYGVGVPVYTRPEVFEFKGKKYTVPKVLLSGNHKEIDKWRGSHKK